MALRTATPAFVKRGSTIAEMLVSLAVLGTALLLLGQLGVAVVGYQQRSEAQRYVAQEANNLTERLTALAFEKLTEEQATSLLDQESQHERDIEFSVRIATDDAEGELLRSKRISIRAAHRRLPNVHCDLMAWKHAAPEEQAQ